MTNVGEVTGSRTPSACADALGERGLAGAERADQHDEVAGAQQPGQRRGRGARVSSGGGQLVLAPHGSAPSAATAVRSAARPARGAPFGPNRMAADGW